MVRIPQVEEISKQYNKTEEFDNSFPFQQLKQQNMRLYNVLDYMRKNNKEFTFNPNLPARVRFCSNYLIYGITADGEKKLHQADFCKYRFCPICNKRKSRKLSYQCSQMIDSINRDYPNDRIRYLFLTLTIPNIPYNSSGDIIRSIIKNMNKSFNKIFSTNKRLRIKKANRLQNTLKGYIKATEITVTRDKGYHPHFHILLAVDKSYFKSKNYCSQEYYTELWKEALKVDYTPIVDIRRVPPIIVDDKPSYKKATKEVLKYSVKLNNVIPINKNMGLQQLEFSSNVVATLTQALHHLRMVVYGGIFKEYKKKLELSDIDSDNVNLIHIDDNKTKESDYVAYYYREFNFNMGIYITTEIEEL